MYKIGIIYAISHEAGKLCKKQLLTCADKNHISLDINTHEHPAELYLNADTQELVELLTSSIDILASKGSRIVIIAANSVHRAFDLLQSYSATKYPDITLLSMIESTVLETQHSQYNSVSIFGSNSTINSKLYHQPLQQAGISIIDLDKRDRERVSDIIKLGKPRPEQTESVLKELNTIVTLQKQSGAEAIILACAELPSFIKPGDLCLPIIDPTQALARFVLMRLAEL